MRKTGLLIASLLMSAPAAASQMTSADDPRLCAGSWKNSGGIEISLMRISNFAVLGIDHSEERFQRSQIDMRAHQMEKFNVGLRFWTPEGTLDAPVAKQFTSNGTYKGHTEGYEDVVDNYVLKLDDAKRLRGATKFAIIWKGSIYHGYGLPTDWNDVLHVVTACRSDNQLIRQK